MISLILAISRNGIIGNKGKLPWHFSEDMKWFKEKTQNNIVIMGRNTWLSLNQKPLKNRINVVVSSKVFPDVDIILDKIDENIEAYELAYPDKEIFIIGGAELYTSTKHLADRIYLTLIDQEYKGDTFINSEILLDAFNLETETQKIENNVLLKFQTYKRIR